MSDENNFSQEEVSGGDSKQDQRSLDGPQGQIGTPESEKKFQDYKFKIVNKKPSNYDETAEQEYLAHEEQRLKNIISPNIPSIKVNDVELDE